MALRRPSLVLIGVVLAVAGACTSDAEQPEVAASPTAAATSPAPRAAPGTVAATSPSDPQDPELAALALEQLRPLPGYDLAAPTEALADAMRNTTLAVLDDVYAQDAAGEVVVRQLRQGQFQRGFVVAHAVDESLAGQERAEEAARTLASVLAQGPTRANEEQRGDETVYRAENSQLQARVAAFSPTPRTIVSVVTFDQDTMTAVLDALLPA